MVLGFDFSLGFFTILCASEGSRSFMGGSDVLHCVQVPLTGTTVAPFGAHWSVVGLYIGSSLCTLFVVMGTPLMLYCNGPTP